MNKEQRHNTEFHATGIDRRSFLHLAGFSFASLALAGCEQTRIEKVIPYLIKPEEITPGKAYWYASTCGACSAGCGVLVKNRDGRPIKLEGNPEHPLSRGGLCVVGQASVLGLYDNLRLRRPLAHGRDSDWASVDREIMARLAEIRQNRGAVRFLTGTLTGPTTETTLSEFLGSFADGRHVMYDPLSCSAILDAHERTHGARLLPRYRFDRAESIVSFDADFLGTWISPVEYTKGYTAGRMLEGTPPRCSRHIQLEARLSLTGAKADKRYRVTGAEQKEILMQLASLLAQRAGRSAWIQTSAQSSPIANRLADELWGKRGKSLVLCGTNNLTQQLLVNTVNALLGNYGATISLEEYSRQREGSDSALQQLLGEIEHGKVAALLVAGVNPVYDLPGGEELGRQLAKLPLVVSFAERVDETAAWAHFVCPDHHFLESWSDAEPINGLVTVAQPAIAPLGRTRALVESLAAWMGNPQSARELMQATWRTRVFTRQKEQRDFQKFWDSAVHDGFVRVAPVSPRVTAFSPVNFRNSESRTNEGEALTLVLYPSVALLEGRHAHNAWLQEVPDPISKVAWENSASLSPSTAARFGISQGDVVRLTPAEKNSVHVELPAVIQPGQHDGVVAVALGYGRRGTERFTNVGPRWLEARPTVTAGETVGKNVSPFLTIEQGYLTYDGQPVRLEKTGATRRLALTQTYPSIDEPAALAVEGAERRPLVQQTTLAAYAADPTAGSFPRPHSHSMWPEQHFYRGQHWGMVIDLNACTGCAACVVSCQAENNIPVVGRDEVMRNREMHWLRIDRYFVENGEDLDVVHQPMLCHHCDNAPCETVCPVLATVHSEEGLNQQVYNRCVGTRYCANNCPYKIRRFNWFDYPRENRLQNMVLNPDVVVRSRGVMEKCSFCVQRIQEAKIEAKRTGVSVADGAVETACQQSCPAQAIVFGDMNDPESGVAKRINDPRHYRLLAELEIRPSVGYMTIVRNRDDERGGVNDG